MSKFNGLLGEGRKILTAGIVFHVNKIFIIQIKAHLQLSPATPELVLSDLLHVSEKTL